MGVLFTNALTPATGIVSLAWVSSRLLGRPSSRLTSIVVAPVSFIPAATM